MVSIALLDISFCSFTVFLIWLTVFSYISLSFFEDHSKLDYYYYNNNYNNYYYYRSNFDCTITGRLQISISLQSVIEAFFSFFLLVMTRFLDYSQSLWSCVGICAFEVRGNSSYLH